MLVVVLLLHAHPVVQDGRLNLIRCYACSSHFCCVCMSALRVKPGLHFKGNPRCKQHSDN
jgi:hypothetical protein